ncbi:MAG: hypothetical protein PHH44_00020 [bacterium]|nr:hypothetical protein [bacterium]
MNWSPFNMDFGADYNQAAWQAFREGCIGWGIIFELDAMSEAAYDMMGACYGAQYVDVAIVTTSQWLQIQSGTLFGKGGLLNSGEYFRIGIGRKYGDSVFRIGGKVVKVLTGKEHIDLWKRGSL